MPKASTIVLGVSGSVAAYRAADLARELMRAGHSVRVLLTDGARRFVTPALFEALTGQPVLESAFEEPVAGRMAHIDWAREADAVVVAPATANTLARLAHGIGDDMLTTLVLATTAPLVLAPAMNPHMLANEATAASLKILEGRATLVTPDEGDVACGENGRGKLASVARIAAAVESVLADRTRLAGRRVLITSGPTQEPLDAVRFLTNRSSGKMGAALARAALLMGADVTVVAGPSTAAYPLGAKVVRVRTALEMRDAALEAGGDLIVAAAAVSDYRPASAYEGKMRRGEGSLHIELVPNPDIVAALAARYPQATVVGFAAEPTAGLDVAREKLVRKGLFAIAANDVSDPAIGFDADDNALRLVMKGGEVRESGRRSKLGCARWLLEQLPNERTRGV